MREILFRGKRTDNDEWVKGFYVCIPDTHYIMTGKFDSLTNGIINSEAYEIDPNTVGQFTGLTDRNGVKIFKGGYRACESVFVLLYRLRNILARRGTLCLQDEIRYTLCDMR